MKARLRKSLIIASIIALPLIINYLIQKNFNKKYGSKNKNRIYNWKFGDIRYTKSGNGTPLLLIHGIGIGAGLHEWDKNIEELSKKYKVYAIDLLGFGYSDKPAISYSPYIYIKLINDFIKNVIGSKTLVAANSHGAAFAVAAYNFEPGNFEKMLLISPTGIGISKNQPVNSDKWLQRILDLPYIGTTIYNAMASKINLRHHLDEYVFSNDSFVNKKNISKYYEAAHYGGINAKYPISAFMSRFLNIDIERLFFNVDIPVHLIWGEKNECNPVENASILKKIKSEATLSIFKNTKALPHFESCKIFNNLCMDFFE